MARNIGTPVPKPAKEYKQTYAERKASQQTTLPNGDIVNSASSTNLSFYLAFQNKTLSVSCGYMKHDVPFLIWDSIPDCDPGVCPVADKCRYATSWQGRKCNIQSKYIKRAYQYLCEKISASVDAVKMMDIGFNLMVLYGHLIKFKLIEAGLGHNVMGYTQKGGPYIHPVYAEIRRVLKDISSMQKEIFSSKEGRVMASDMEEYMHGDPTFYESIIPKGSFASNNEVSVAMRTKGKQ